MRAEYANAPPPPYNKTFHFRRQDFIISPLKNFTLFVGFLYVFIKVFWGGGEGVPDYIVRWKGSGLLHAVLGCCLPIGLEILVFCFCLSPSLKKKKKKNPLQRTVPPLFIYRPHYSHCLQSSDDYRQYIYIYISILSHRQHHVYHQAQLHLSLFSFPNGLLQHMIPSSSSSANFGYAPMAD